MKILVVTRGQFDLYQSQSLDEIEHVAKTAETCQHYTVLKAEPFPQREAALCVACV